MLLESEAWLLNYFSLIKKLKNVSALMESLTVGLKVRRHAQKNYESIVVQAV